MNKIKNFLKMQKLPEATDRKWDDACAKKKTPKKTIPAKRRDMLSLQMDSSD